MAILPFTFRVEKKLESLFRVVRKGFYGVAKRKKRVWLVGRDSYGIRRSLLRRHSLAALLMFGKSICG